MIVARLMFWKSGTARTRSIFLQYFCSFLDFPDSSFPWAPQQFMFGITFLNPLCISRFAQKLRLWDPGSTPADAERKWREQLQDPAIEKREFRGQILIPDFTHIATVATSSGSATLILVTVMEPGSEPSDPERGAAPQ